MSRHNSCSDAAQARTGAGISMPKFSQFLFLLAVLCLSGCGPSREEMEYREASKALSDSISAALPGITTDTIGGITHNFIRKADLKCKVENVLASTKRIEDLVALTGGYVSKSDLVSTINHYTAVRFNEDSLLESTFYTIGNVMAIRVPSRQLDTLVRVITDLSLFVDHRRLSSDDVKMQLYANVLSQKRLERYNRQLEKKVETHAAPLKQIAAAEESMLSKQAQSDEKNIASFDLADQVNYSTITLDLYQQEQEQRKVIPMPLHIQPYEPGFASKLGAAFAHGFDLLKTCFLFLINSWGLILILVLLVIGIRKLMRYKLPELK